VSFDVDVGVGVDEFDRRRRESLNRKMVDSNERHETFFPLKKNNSGSMFFWFSGETPSGQNVIGPIVIMPNIICLSFQAAVLIQRHSVSCYFDKSRLSFYSTFDPNVILPIDIRPNVAQPIGT